MAAATVPLLQQSKVFVWYQWRSLPSCFLTQAMPCRRCIQLCSPALDCLPSSDIDLKPYATWPFNHRGWRVLRSSGKLIAASFCLLVGERLDQPIISRGYAHISPVLGSTSSCNFNSKNLWSYISSHPLKRKDFYLWMTLPYSGTTAWSCWHRVDVVYITAASWAWSLTWSRISTTSHSKDLVGHSSDFTGYSGWLWRWPELVKCHVIMLKYGAGWRI